MNRIDRLTAILIQLQSKRVVKAKEIAERFQISLRTVYRDIRALEEAGVPIGAEAGVGYYLIEGYHLPPVMFTNEEATAMMMAGKLFEKFSDLSAKKEFESALFKIKAVLNSGDKDHVEDLQDKISVFSALDSKGEKQSHCLIEVQSALAGNAILNIEYFSPYENKISQRDIEPIGLCFYAAHWHLIGYCQMRNDYRDFRVDRIQKIKVTGRHFQRDCHDSLQNIIKAMQAKIDLQKVVVRFDKTAPYHLLMTKFYYGFVEETDLGDSIEMVFFINDLSVFGRWLLTFGNTAQIQSPDELKEIVVQFSRELMEHYL